MAAGYDAGQSSRKKERFAYDVFLSFRGEDVRKSFIDHLRMALCQTGITVFYDDKGLERGDEIQSKLYEAIESSEIAIVTFSHTYATSRWCLDELVKIMERRSLGLTALPVFYKVDPTHVRHQSGPYEKAFPEHEAKYGCQRVNKWKQAMRSAADLAGFGLQNQANGYKAQFIKLIVDEVVRKLDKRRLDIPKYMVGTESYLIQGINKWLQNGSSQIEVGIIYGQGGVGKTTTAKVVYNENYHTFESSSFLEGVRTAYGNDIEFIRLQKQLICNITSMETVNNIDSVSQGRQKIKRVIGTKKILIVLDDVDEEMELDKMFDFPDWFFPGSKIIITTRSRSLLMNEKSIARFEACLLGDEESIELFSYHAFGQNYPLQNHEKITMLFIKYCDGLPLALEVLASSLRSISFEKWELKFARLQEYPLDKVNNILKWSFDSIEQSTVKDIFLHIAFYMVGRKKEYALKILDGCHLHGEIGLENLIGKCLVSVNYSGTLMMHHLIQQMGYEVVRQKPPIELGYRSRLLGPRDAYEVLRKKTGTSLVKGLHLNNPNPLDNDTSSEEPYARHSAKRMRTTYINSDLSRQVSLYVKSIKTDAFTKLSNLDLLLLENVQLDGSFENFPKGIKWLLWRGCPLNEIPLDYDLEELVVLDLQKSSLVHIWNDSKYMGALKILDLSHSHHLVSTPDLYNAPMLEWISCEGCINLNEVHESTGKLENLTCLNLKECINLTTLPESIGTLKKLTRYIVEGCRNLRNLPLNTLSSVECLNLGGCFSFFEGSNLAESSTTALESSSNIIIPTASNCPNRSLLVKYPVPCPPPPMLFNIFLPSLKKLYLANCGISRHDVMEMISCAPSLEHLDLRYNLISVMSSMNRGPCLKLKFLDLDYCPNLQSISDILEGCDLGIEDCHALKKITYYRQLSVIKLDKKRQLIEGNDSCRKQVEMGYGVSAAAVIELTSEMNEDRASYLGFPNLNTFDYQGVDRSYFGRGIYQAGIYCVFLRGGHIANWFLPMKAFRGERRVRYRVPSFHPDERERPIRGLNIGIVCTGISLCHVITNVSKMWQWFYSPPWLPVVKDKEFTWLSHWCVTEHRQIKPDDELEIVVEFCEYIGVKVIYEDEEHIDGEGAEKDDDKFHLTTSKSVDSSRFWEERMSIPTTSKEEKMQLDIQKGRKEDHEEYVSAAADSVSYTDNLGSEDDDEEDDCDATASLESLHDDGLNNDDNHLSKVMNSANISTSDDKGDSSGDVDVWYNNIFRSHDLSLYLYKEVKQEMDEENSCDASAPYLRKYKLNFRSDPD